MSFCLINVKDERLFDTFNISSAQESRALFDW
jgi:hypothetical protein